LNKYSFNKILKNKIIYIYVYYKIIAGYGGKNVFVAAKYNNKNLKLFGKYIIPYSLDG
jgi:hypothetical protein